MEQPDKKPHLCEGDEGRCGEVAIAGGRYCGAHLSKSLNGFHREMFDNR